MVELHRTFGLGGGKPGGHAGGIHTKNGGKAASGRAASPQTAAATAVKLPAQGALPRSIPALVAAAALPADRLSVSIVTFARFFSLPLKPDLMAAIRRQAIAQTPMPQTTPADSAAAGKRVTLALSAAAAESKGVELNLKGLEAYAGAIDPDWDEKDPFSGRHGSRQGSGGRDPHEKQHNDQEKESADEKAGVLQGPELKKLALESAEKDPLLAILNRMPGKNGRRWVVLPFDYSSNGRDFRVTLRIMLEGENPAGNQAGSMILDIAECPAAHESPGRWLFAAESAGSAINRLAVYLKLELPPQSHAQCITELSGIMGILPGNISIQSFEGDFPCESGCGTDFSLDEAV
jgi:hypothetical protein